ncbi:hypothetical protein PoB_003857100 [Plakobranchus ocellatus]|uniref:Secreted protein n=1 Tax=Plakobranchus ocellatus TaxID=259542 RepID=A0AAV4AVA8_9GAST|nr:hypothetical protein PoB_003857100 [Plakobranchus ocellatus]
MWFSNASSTFCLMSRMPLLGSAHAHRCVGGRLEVGLVSSMKCARLGIFEKNLSSFTIKSNLRETLQDSPRILPLLKRCRTFIETHRKVSTSSRAREAD